jgi:transposase
LHPIQEEPESADPLRHGALPQRHRIEIAFGRIKDWRRIATRYDRCATTFFSAITLAVIVIFWLKQ